MTAAQTDCTISASDYFVPLYAGRTGRLLFSGGTGRLMLIFRNVVDRWRPQRESVEDVAAFRTFSDSVFGDLIVKLEHRRGDLTYACSRCLRARKT